VHHFVWDIVVYVNESRVKFSFGLLISVTVDLTLDEPAFLHGRKNLKPKMKFRKINIPCTFIVVTSELNIQKFYYEPILCLCSNTFSK
jgi:hypothetical protein